MTGNKLIDGTVYSIKDNLAGSAIGAGLFYFGVKKFAPGTGFIVMAALVITGAVVGSSVQYKLKQRGVSGKTKLVVKQEDPTK